MKYEDLAKKDPVKAICEVARLSTKRHAPPEAPSYAADDPLMMIRLNAFLEKAGVMRPFTGGRGLEDGHLPELSPPPPEFAQRVGVALVYAWAEGYAAGEDDGRTKAQLEAGSDKDAIGPYLEALADVMSQIRDDSERGVKTALGLEDTAKPSPALNTQLKASYNKKNKIVLELRGKNRIERNDDSFRNLLSQARALLQLDSPSEK